MKYPEIQKYQLEKDSIIDSSGKTISTVLDYWKWAHSNLLDNTERGIFAEYLVSAAIGNNSCVRVNWEKYDLISKEGITIEVKTSAYLQTWGQERLSDIRFGIARTKGYDSATNTYEDEEKRQAQVYVFCIHSEMDQKNVNPLDTRQWQFYVLASEVLNNSTTYSKARSIGINPLIKLGASKCRFEELHAKIKDVVNA